MVLKLHFSSLIKHIFVRSFRFFNTVFEKKPLLFFPIKSSNQNLQLKSLIDYCSKTFKVRYGMKLDSEVQIYALSNGINSVSVSLAFHT